MSFRVEPQALRTYAGQLADAHHLGALTGGSSEALRQVAARYERSDLRAEGAIDASFPAVPRPTPSRD